MDAAAQSLSTAGHRACGPLAQLCGLGMSEAVYTLIAVGWGSPYTFLFAL